MSTELKNVSSETVQRSNINQLGKGEGEGYERRWDGPQE